MLDDLVSFFISIHDRFSVVDCDGLGNASPLLHLAFLFQKSHIFFNLLPNVQTIEHVLCNLIFICYY